MFVPGGKPEGRYTGGGGGGWIFVRNLSALQSFIYPYSNFPGSGRGNAKIKIDLESALLLNCCSAADFFVCGDKSG